MSDESTAPGAPLDETKGELSLSVASQATKVPKGDDGKLTVDQARQILSQSTSNKAAADLLLADHAQLKDKVNKLKNLLGRSAKAQRETRIDLDASQKRLAEAQTQIEKLHKKIDKLTNRPTHMELLADFEANFDKAMLSVGNQQTGQSTQGAADESSSHFEHEVSTSAYADVTDALLMQELNDYKQRCEKLEGLHQSLVQRSSHLEKDAAAHRQEREDLQTKLAHLELEKRMAVMEAEHARKESESKAASLAEMQMEIELLQKSSFTANARAAQGEQLIKTVKTDRQHAQQLESQVQALQEWALASAEAKTLAQERVRLLGAQLKSLQQQHVLGVVKNSNDNEKVLWQNTGSLVIGAGDVGAKVYPLGREHTSKLKLSDRVILRWKFDLNASDQTIDFSILKGKCEDKMSRQHASYLIKDRHVHGGAGGDTEGAFAVENTCTLVWSNANAWIRPKTVRYNVEAIVLSDR